MNPRFKAAAELARTDPNAAYDKLASGFDGLKVKAKGTFAKGLKDGETYTLRKSEKSQGVDTYEFLRGSKVVARFDEAAIKRFLRNGESDDANGLVKTAADNDALDRAMARAMRSLALDVIAPLKGLSKTLDTFKVYRNTTGEYEQDFKTPGAVNRILEDAQKAAALLGDAMHMTEGR